MRDCRRSLRFCCMGVHGTTPWRYALVLAGAFAGHFLAQPSVTDLKRLMREVRPAHSTIVLFSRSFVHFLTRHGNTGCPYVPDGLGKGGVVEE